MTPREFVAATDKAISQQSQSSPNNTQEIKRARTQERADAAFADLIESMAAAVTFLPELERVKVQRLSGEDFGHGQTLIGWAKIFFDACDDAGLQPQVDMSESTWFISAGRIFRGNPVAISVAVPSAFRRGISQLG